MILHTSILLINSVYGEETNANVTMLLSPAWSSSIISTYLDMNQDIRSEVYRTCILSIHIELRTNTNDTHNFTDFSMLFSTLFSTLTLRKLIKLTFEMIPSRCLSYCPGDGVSDGEGLVAVYEIEKLIVMAHGISHVSYQSDRYSTTSLATRQTAMKKDTMSASIIPAIMVYCKACIARRQNIQ